MSEQADSVGRSPHRRLRSSTLAWLLYAACIAYGSLIPFQFIWDRSAAAEKLAEVPLDPMRAASGRHVSFPDVAQNVLLFVPFGTIGLLAMRPRRSIGAACAKVIGVGAVFSLVIEAAQLFTADRSTALTDVLSDTIGTGIGSLALVVARPMRHRAAAALSWAAQDRRRAFGATSALALAALAAWVPFDPTFDVSTIVSKVRALETDGWQISAWMRQGGAADAVRGLLLGAALADWWPSIGGAARRAAAAATLAVAIVVCLTVTQVFITTRQPGLCALCVESGAAIVGGLLVAFRRTIDARWSMRLVIAAVIAGLIADALIAAWVGLAASHSAWHNDGAYVMASIASITTWALVFAPIGFAAPRLSSTGEFGVTGAILAAVLAAIVGPLLRPPLGWSGDAAAIAGALAGTWTATAGRRRFEAAIAVADSRR